MCNLVHHSIGTSGPHISILSCFNLWPCLLVLLWDLLRVMQVNILIIFILLKSVDTVLWRNTLMLLILIKPTSTVLLTRVEILTLKLLRIFDIPIIYILSARWILTALGPVVEGLTRGIVMHQISLVGLIHDWTRWFWPSYTLRFLILKDIWILLRITLCSSGTRTSCL